MLAALRQRDGGAERSGASPPRGGRNKSHSVAVVPLMPAEGAVRRARPAIADRHRRRNASPVTRIC